MSKSSAWIFALTLGVALWAGFAAGQATTARKYMPADNPNAPYSKSVLIGDTLYVAGDGVINPKTNAPYEDPAEEARQLMDSYAKTLAAAGMSFDDLVYVTVYCADLSLYKTFNDVYRARFKKEFPARAFIGAGSLLNGMRFEIQGIAVRR